MTALINNRQKIVLTLIFTHSNALLNISESTPTCDDMGQLPVKPVFLLLLAVINR